MSNLNDVDMSEATDLSEGFSAIPPGDYMLVMESSERKAFGQPGSEVDKLECVFLVCSGEYENSKVREWFDLWNPDAEKRGRATGRFKALCEAVLGQPNAINNDSSSLHSKLFAAFVDNVPQWDKATQANHPTKRTNKMGWKKGNVRSMADFNAAGGAQPVGAQGTKAAAAAIAGQQASQTAPVNKAAAAPVVPGQGKAPWKNK